MKFSCCIVVARYWATACSSAADVVFAVEVGVGEDVVGLVHPAARIAASITTANVPAKNCFFMVNPCKLLITRLVLQSPGL